MFGCCVAGRLIQTNLQQVDETHAYFELTNASTINHICVFLLGTIHFPDGYGATVHFFWPGKGFQLLGMLSNEKPSAIFRLRGTFQSSTSSDSTTGTFSSLSTAANASLPTDVTAILGLAIEPLTQIHQVLPTTLMKAIAPADPSKDTAILAERIVKHQFNYINSFIGGAASTRNTDIAVPMSVLAKWYESILAKLKAGGTAFLERE
ncbi:hypothetical protein AMATHDRAFT_64291 [Amanita thiersii Skay4041]|uniref:Uncharacterized protein n=1 Tax=Amanita thiersii Skay4041 TaxID=703135 RepID=A0A2A9NML7_9AGAR|nr:hypothetical protein AMATHDRAFT_64291 [Amanita thiersii Skay4041]